MARSWASFYAGTLQDATRFSPATLQAPMTIRGAGCCTGRQVSLDVLERCVTAPDDREGDAYALVGGPYGLAARLEGTGSTALPPFLDLTLDSSLIWV